MKKIKEKKKREKQSCEAVARFAAGREPALVDVVD